LLAACFCLVAYFSRTCQLTCYLEVCDTLLVFGYYEASVYEVSYYYEDTLLVYEYYEASVYEVSYYYEDTLLVFGYYEASDYEASYYYEA
jgi:hypothetical protein